MSADYLLGRDSAESRRLNDQHDVWIRNLGFTIHPRVAAHLPDDATIGDVGTGTGVWLLDISKPWPSATLHGFDVSAAQLQYPEEGQGNLHFQLADVRQPFPEELHGKFDLVHVRLLVFALKVEDWPICVRNLRQLLKPSGWLQWEEIDPTPFNAVLQSNTDTKTASLTRTLDTFLVGVGKSRPEALLGYKHLKDAFHSEGMNEVGEDVVSSERVLECRTMATKVMIRMMLETMQLAAKARGVEKSPEEEVELARELEAEVHGGAYLQFYIRCVTGRK